MTVKLTAITLVKSAEVIITGYLRIKLYLLKGNVLSDSAELIASEAIPRFVDFILESDATYENGLRESVNSELKKFILNFITKEEKLISERKKKANLENAKRGGVKTTEGKAISKNNSLKHGILAQASVQGDSISLEEAYKHFSREFSPDRPSREILVQQLALTAIRLSRCSRLEAEIFNEKTRWHQNVATTLEQLATLGERYENRLVSRMLSLIEVLKKE